MKFVFKDKFLNQLSTYTSDFQKLILDAIEEVRIYVTTQKFAYGLRIKKIGPNTFEARVSDKIRIVWVKKEDVIYFVLIGDHGQVRRFIRNI